MPVAVAVTTLADGVEDNKRFVDVSLALTSTYDATQAADGFLIPMVKLPIREVTEIRALQFAGAGGAAGVQLGGTKAAPTIKLRGFDVADGTAVSPADTETPPATLRVRLIGA
jgi:hypothetical protein